MKIRHIDDFDLVFRGINELQTHLEDIAEEEVSDLYTFIIDDKDYSFDEAVAWASGRICDGKDFTVTHRHLYPWKNKD